MSGVNRLTAHDLDILTEIGNIGASHAATALSQLLGRPVLVSLSRAQLCDFGEIPELAGGSESVVLAVFLHLKGDFSGSILLMVPREVAVYLIRNLLPDIGSGEEFSDFGLSALAEVGNILCGSYTTSIATLTSLRITQSVPDVAMDMAGAILDSIIAATAVSDSVLLINTSISAGDESLPGKLFLMPDVGATVPLLGALK